MPRLDELIEEIASTLSASVKAYNLPKIATSLGMETSEKGEAFSSKRAYVVKQLVGWPKQKLLDLAKNVYETFPVDSLQQQIEVFDQSQPFQISIITRQHLLACIDTLPPIQGKMTIVEFVERLWPIGSMPSSGKDHRCHSARDEIDQHMVRNQDLSFSEMLGYLGLNGMSNRKLVELLELSVHPLVRTDDEQCQFVEVLNGYLKNDGIALIPAERMSGYEVYRINVLSCGVKGTAKNLIFASNGPKPEIVLSDAINNDIEVVRNEEFCLVYDQPIGREGLLWKQLVTWWALKTKQNIDEATERSLYSRLSQSLGSPPERCMFKAYYGQCRKALGDRLPALIPQVYLHYDPYTWKQLGQRRLPRQRMDFLLLLSPFERIVIEVDGKQHYSDGDRSSPLKYAEMVEADRDLRLLGYEVYRFGGHELVDGQGEDTTAAFFTRLFKKHGIRTVLDASSDQD